MEQEDDIKLRSEKLRNIMGCIPRRLVMTGTIIIVIVTIVLIAFAWIGLK